MKYIKKFNESMSPREFVYLRNELEKFCDENLAYLKDSGYTIHLASDEGKITIIIVKTGLDNNKAKKFTWNEIKDDFIPFYELLKSIYNLVPCGTSDEFVAFNGWAITIPDSEIEDFDGTFTIPARIPKKTDGLTDIRVSVGSKKKK